MDSTQFGPFINIRNNEPISLFKYLLFYPIQHISLYPCNCVYHQANTGVAILVTRTLNLFLFSANQTTELKVEEDAIEEVSLKSLHFLICMLVKYKEFSSCSFSVLFSFFFQSWKMIGNLFL